MKELRLRHKGIYHTVCLLISITAALIVWTAVSAIPDIGSVFVSPVKVWNALVENISSGYLWIQVRDSLIRVIGGFLLGFICSIPVAFLLGWYEGFRVIVEPWIQFLRTIPPIALIPIVIATFGIGTSAKVAIIFFAVFLTMVVTIYQGVKNVDVTLIKAMRVFDANDAQIFINVVVSFYPIYPDRCKTWIGISINNACRRRTNRRATGLGTMIQQAGMYFKMDVVLMGIVVIGIIGFIFDKIVLFMEKKLTSWQEVK